MMADSLIQRNPFSRLLLPFCNRRWKHATQFQWTGITPVPAETATPLYWSSDDKEFMSRVTVSHSANPTSFT
jgi:hypothetical protein